MQGKRKDISLCYQKKSVKKLNYNFVVLFIFQRRVITKPSDFSVSRRGKKHTGL